MPPRAVPHAVAGRQGAGPALALGLLLLAVPAVLAGCAEGTPEGTPTASAPSGPASPGGAGTDQPAEPRARLAALAAAARDRYLVASYTLSAAGRPDRTVAVTNAVDGSWRVDIPGGVLGGTADVSIAQNSAGLFQCALPSAQRPEPATCVRVADPGQRLAEGIDPRLQHPFSDWRDVLTDRRAPLSVSTRALPGARGTCFAVESTSASVSPPLDVGIYCYDHDGTLTAARLAAGTLMLASAPTAGPATITLPGPVVAGEPLRTAGPPTAERPDPGTGQVPPIEHEPTVADGQAD